MKTETIVMCVVALILGMLLANMLKSVCGCKTVEGQPGPTATTSSAQTSEGSVKGCVPNSTYPNAIVCTSITDEEKCKSSIWRAYCKWNN